MLSRPGRGWIYCLTYPVVLHTVRWQGRHRMINVEEAVSWEWFSCCSHGTLWWFQLPDSSADLATYISAWFQASAANWLSTALFCVVTQRVVLVPYRPWDSWTLRMGLIGCPETSAVNYHYPLRNSPEERSSLRQSLILCNSRQAEGSNHEMSFIWPHRNTLYTACMAYSSFLFELSFYWNQTDGNVIRVNSAISFATYKQQIFPLS